MAKGRRRRSFRERLVSGDPDDRKEMGLPPRLLEASLPPDLLVGFKPMESVWSFEERHLELFYGVMTGLGLRAHANRWRKACQIQGRVGRALSAASRGPAIPREPRPLGEDKPAMALDAEDGFRVVRTLRILRVLGPAVLGQGLSEADLLSLGFRLGEITTRMLEVRVLEPRAVDGIAASRRMSSMGERRWEDQPEWWARWQAESRGIVEEARRRGQPVPSKRARAQAIQKLDPFCPASVETIRKRL